MNCEHLGYFEDFLLIRPHPLWPKQMGSKMYPVSLPAEQAGRKLGVAGVRRFELKHDVVLRKGVNEVRWRASKSKPLLVETYLQRLEGKRI